MSSQIWGRLDWSLDLDKDGHRDYEIEWLVCADDVLDGPGIIYFTPGLPLPGSYWLYGHDNDPWAYCSPQIKITPVITGEPNKWWKVKNYFSTRPLRRCQDTPVDNPLLEPYRISGTFNPKEEEAYFDRFGKPLVTSAYEPLTGKEVEFDTSKPTVKIGMNLPTLPLDIFAPLIHYVNDSPMWGLAKRCVKLSNATWSRNIYGSCNFYYSVDFDFDIDPNTFDRQIYDTGTLYLKPGNDPNTGNPWDPSDPKSYEVNKTDSGERTRVWLDGNGGKLADLTTPVTRNIEKYFETNLILNLGVPPILA